MRILDSSLNRFVQSDGKSITYPEYVPNLIYLGAKPEDIQIIQSNEDVDEFNRLTNAQLLIAANLTDLPKPNKWNIPDQFKRLDVDQLIIRLFEQKVAGKQSKEYLIKAIARINKELSEYKNRNLYDLLRTLHYVIKTFEDKNLTWGVGRGSSCASYVLYILGLHKVDCIKYNIELSEFFRD